MNTVTTINLAGRSYTLEEPGYHALTEYLDKASKKLENNPDKEEIIKDFELAIAEKCENYLTIRKNVITKDEVAAIIHEMGPVEGTSKTDGTGGESSDARTESTHPKRLYRIPEGEMIGGVCTGLAVYFNIDVTLVRIIFIILALLTHGVWILVYFIMMMVVPVAYTSQEKAEASGKPPVTAHELLQKAKDGYNNFKNSKEWKQWKRQWREEQKRSKQAYTYHYQPSPFYEFMQNILGLVWFLIIVGLLWFAYKYIGPVHHTFDVIGVAWEKVLQKILNHFNH